MILAHVLAVKPHISIQNMIWDHPHGGKTHEESFVHTLQPPKHRFWLVVHCFIMHFWHLSKKVFRTICYIQFFMLILMVIFIFAIYGLFDELWLIYFWYFFDFSVFFGFWGSFTRTRTHPLVLCSITASHARAHTPWGRRVRRSPFNCNVTETKSSWSHRKRRLWKSSCGPHEK